LESVTIKDIKQE